MEDIGEGGVGRINNLGQVLGPLSTWSRKCGRRAIELEPGIALGYAYGINDRASLAGRVQKRATVRVLPGGADACARRSGDGGRIAALTRASQGPDLLLPQGIGPLPHARRPSRSGSPGAAQRNPGADASRPYRTEVPLVANFPHFRFALCGLHRLRRVVSQGITPAAGVGLSASDRTFVSSKITGCNHSISGGRTGAERSSASASSKSTPGLVIETSQDPKGSD